MRGTVLLNGEFVARDEATLEVDNGGWLHGAGLFETMRAVRGRLFRLDAHLDRLCRSAEELLLPIPRERLPSAADVCELLKRNGLTDARVRLTVTAGNLLETRGSNGEGAEDPLTVCLTAAASSNYPASVYDHGFSVLLSQYRQSSADPTVGHKTTSYLPRLIALREALAADCDEALWFTPDNLLAEGSISNVFTVKSGTVYTPPLDTPVLPGIARSVVLELCRERNIEAEERVLAIDDVLDADEVFLTNAVMQVMPVCHVEQRAIGGGKPGPVTGALRAAYGDAVDEECGRDG